MMTSRSEMKEQEQINEIGNIIQKKADGVNFDDASDCAVAIYRANYRKIPNKILANKVYSDTTLKSWTKQDLIEHIRILENNWACAEQNLEVQAKNFEKRLKQDMKDKSKEIFTELFEKHTEIYNRFVFCKDPDYGDEEINAIINFSDILAFEIEEYFKEKFGVDFED